MLITGEVKFPTNPSKERRCNRVSLPKVKGPCIHLGTVIDKRDIEQQHVNCRGKWLHRCDLHGECRLNDHRAPHNCATCDDWVDEYQNPLDDPHFETRHLLYHVYPFRENGTWQRNLDALKLRLPLFNGKRVCAIAIDDKCDPAGVVKQHLRGCGFEYIEVENDAFLREVKTWEPLWDKVIRLDGCTFYGHAKAVSRQFDPGNSCHLWTDIMYETLLDYWPRVQRSLNSHEITGTFKKVGRGFVGCRSKWHYSGSFFWTRNEKFRRRDWRNIPKQWWGTEAVPGMLYEPQEAGVVFHEGQQTRLNVYSPKYLNEIVLPELRAWRVENTANRSVIGS